MDLSDPIVVGCAKFFSIWAIVWTLVQSSSVVPGLKAGADHEDPRVRRLTKNLLALAFGELCCLAAWFFGVVSVEFTHPAVAEGWPAWAHGLMTAGGVLFLGGLSGAAAIVGHKVGKTAAAVFSQKEGS